MILNRVGENEALIDERLHGAELEPNVLVGNESLRGVGTWRLLRQGCHSGSPSVEDNSDNHLVNGRVELSLKRGGEAHHEAVKNRSVEPIHGSSAPNVSKSACQAAKGEVRRLALSIQVTKGAPSRGNALEEKVDNLVHLGIGTQTSQVSADDNSEIVSVERVRNIKLGETRAKRWR